MARFVALFRGINVGKAKRVAMADLRTLLEGLGYTDVRTLLNSGNAVFSAGGAHKAAHHAQRIRAAVAADLGVDALVVVKSAKDIAAAVARNPLKGMLKNEADASRLLVALTDDDASLRHLVALGQRDWAPEVVHVGPDAAYVFATQGVLESKAAVALLNGLKGTGTTRNWATLLKINALLQTP